MTRVIKFRIWIRSGEWDEKGEKQAFQMISADYLAFDECATIAEHLMEIEDDFYPMQFTGLKDKNGVEIYEGDIVYLAGYGNYECKFPFLELYDAGAENDIGAILGNIYENKDLLDD